MKDIKRVTDRYLQSWGGSQPGRDSEGLPRLPRGVGGDQDEGGLVHREEHHHL